MKAWHISDTHLSFDKDWKPAKPMDQRTWSKGAWTYNGYLKRMSDFGINVIQPDDFTFVTGDIVHDMKELFVPYSLRWLRYNICGTIVICRGNHDKYWDPGRMRQMIADLPNIYILDEGEITTIGPYTIGCYSNHHEKNNDWNNLDGRYIEMAINIVKQAHLKNRVPIMMSHYPVNIKAAELIGKTGLKVYLSGHIHCTRADAQGPDWPLDWNWYNQSAALTDDKTIGECFFSTATTDVVQAKHGQSFKELKVLGVPEKVEAAKTAEVLVMCGLPGSGKSTIAEILEQRGYTRINQDVLGSRKACVKLAEAMLEKDKSILIDRCNFDAEQRKVWVDLAKKHGVTNIRCLYMEVEPIRCLERASARVGHPTITDSIEAERVIGFMNEKFEAPTLGEGFAEVLNANTGFPEEIADLVREKK